MGNETADMVTGSVRLLRRTLDLCSACHAVLAAVVDKWMNGGLGARAASTPLGQALGDDAFDPWADLCALRRMAVVGETAMAAGFDAAPMTEGAAQLADAAWHRLRRRFDPAAKGRP